VNRTPPGRRPTVYGGALDLRLGRLFAGGDGLVDRAAHDARLGKFGVADDPRIVDVFVCQADVVVGNLLQIWKKVLVRARRYLTSPRGRGFAGSIVFASCISALFWPSPLGERWPAIYPWTSRFAASGLSGLGAMENLRARALFGR